MTLRPPAPRTLVKAYGVWASAVVVATVLQFLSIYAATTWFGLHTGSYRTTLDTNHFGENWSEIAVLVSLVPFALIQVYRAVRGFVNRWEPRP